MNIELIKKAELILMTLLVCVWIFLGLVGCSVAPTARAGRTGAGERSGQAQEAPIPLETTAENHGKRCEARYYFGERRSANDEGYSAECYKLQSRLIKAAREGNLVEIREALKLGANANLPVDDSFPPLQTAAASGQTDAVRLLLNNGAQVNQISDFENTPLNAAAASGHSEVIDVLLEKGADACYKSAAGTAGDIARSKGYKQLADVLKAAEIAKCK